MKRKSLLALLLALAICLSFLVACGGTGDNSQGGKDAQTNQGNQTSVNQTGDNQTGNDQTGDDQAPAGDDAEPERPQNQVNMDVPEGTALGDRIADFTFTTYDGTEYNLYDTLAEKKMVLINCWATWCGPCKAEFPYMTEAYEEYKDDIEIFAISCEEEDTDEVLADYVSKVGMTFPVGRDVTNVYGDFSTGYIPISIVVDRFGVVCLVAVGSQDSTDNFRRLFDVFVGDDYTESVLLDSIPGPKPTVDPVDPADLAAALNTEGGTLTFANPTGAYDWPMKIMNKNDRQYAMSTNKYMDNTTSLVSLTVDAEAGQVLAFDYLVSSEAGYDFLTVTINGQAVKFFTGQVDWSTWAYAFPESSSYEIVFRYVKDPYSFEGSDLAAIDEVRLLSAQEGAPILAALPQYPHGDANTITADADAREVVIHDPTGLLASNFGDARCYIISDEMPSFHVTLTNDPDAASITYFADGATNTLGLNNLVDGDHYTVTVPASVSSTYSYVQLYTDPSTAGPMILYFSGEEGLNTFMVRNLSNEDGTMAASWKYADGSAPSSTVTKEGSDVIAEGKSLYTLVFVDQNGEPVEGVIANICDDDSCIPMKSDANGVIGFVYPSFAYHIQILKVPDGYTYDTTQETYLTEAGGVTEFVVTKQ